MKKRTAKRALKWIGITIGVLLIIIAAGAAVMFGPFVKAANSIENLKMGFMQWSLRGTTGLMISLLMAAPQATAKLRNIWFRSCRMAFTRRMGNVTTGSFGCSTIYTQDENGTYFFGRNYDWAECETMIVHTKPENGYESVSTCCLDFLGFGDKYAPDGSMTERMQSTAAIYVPLDGMNAKGLVVADLTAGDDEETYQRTGKVNLTTTTAIRLLLDKAADVDEAVALLKQYDMNSSIGISHHLSIADAHGKSIVVEYVNGEMLVSETKVVTNHYLTDCEKRGVGSAQSRERYDTLAAYSGPTDAPQVRDMLESVAQKNYPKTDGSYEKTMWSIVYCPEGRCADFYFAENYDHEYGLILLGKNGIKDGRQYKLQTKDLCAQAREAGIDYKPARE